MAQDHSENNKRIAKNTLFLYLRMLLSMVISLFTSRVFLQALGVENYGIQNVVGGFLGMASFLFASMSSATSRFITYELGKGYSQKLKDTFSTAVLIHAGLALAIVVLAETVGLWFLTNKLVIPENRMFAAHVVYQLSLVGMVLGIMQSPYGAVMISHEHMKIYAYVEILNVSLKLLILYLVIAIPGDKLIICSILLFIQSFIIWLVYRIYCIRHFKEARFHYVWDKNVMKPMFEFSGWDLFGNFSVMMRTQGVSVLLNLFFGPIINAASGIAATVQGAVMNFSTNIITAYRPQLIKQYAKGEYDYLFSLSRDAIKVSSMLLMLLTVPLMINLDFVIGLWLGQVPEYVVPICQVTLVYNFLATISIILAAIIHATGKMKRISLINGSIYIMVIPITYLAYKSGSHDPILPFILNVVGISIGVLSNAYSIKLYIPSFKLRYFIFKEYLLTMVLFGGVLGITYFCMQFMEQGWFRLLLSIAFSTGIIIVCGLAFYMPKELQQKCLYVIKSKLGFVSKN